MERQADMLVWVDLETTGTDSYWDQIIEVAAIWTDQELNELDHFEGTISMNPTARDRLEETEAVLKMHKANGLYQILTEGEGDYADNIELDEAISAKAQEVNLKHDRRGQQRQILSGSGVGHFDKIFIESQLPKLNEFLQYYTIDIGVIRRAWRMFSGKPCPPSGVSTKSHRAMDDIRQHLEEAKQYQQLWAELT